MAPLVGWLDGVGEFCKEIMAAALILHERACIFGVVGWSRLPFLPESYQNAFLIAVVESHKASRLKQAAVRQKLRMAQSARAGSMVDPHEFDRAVAGQQLGQLPLFFSRILSRTYPFLALHLVLSTRPCPVAFGKVERQFDAVLIAAFFQFGENITMQRSPGHLSIGGFGIPETEAVVMLGQKQYVPHSGILCSLGPLIGIRILCPEQRDILDAGSPFLAGERAEAPADKHTPFQFFQLIRPLDEKLWIWRAFHAGVDWILGKDFPWHRKEKRNQNQ